MRPYLAALAAIAALVLVAFGGIWFATRLPGGGPDASPGAGAAPAVEPVVPLPPPPAVLPSQRTEPPPPPLLTDSAPPPPPKDSWEAVTPMPRLASLGPLGGAIRRALADREEALARCYDEDEQARHGPTVPATAGDAAGEEGGATPTLMLEIETSAGAARIVEATVDVRGGASDGLFSCAQQVLRGLSVSHPGTPAGRRYRVPMALTR